MKQGVVMKFVSMLALVAAVLAFPAASGADAACIKKEHAKGTSACIAKAKCDGVTSRKEQAKLCNK